MRRFILSVLFIVLCSPSCTILRTEKSSRPPVVVLPPTQMVKTSGAMVNPIDTNRPITKTIYINQVVPDKDYYHRVDSILNKRMSLYADSSRTFIGSQSILLLDYKSTLLNNIKLIDSLKKEKKEKRELKQDNQQKDVVIEASVNADYKIATYSYLFLILLFILATIKQYRLKREILAELRR